MIARTVSETAWQAQIVSLARTLGFMTYHTLDSRGSDRGFYDLTMIGSRRLILLEVKKQAGSHAVLTTDQVTWLDGAAGVRDSGNWGLEVYGAVRPLDRDALVLMLQGASERDGALHQWCSSSACGRCTMERDRAEIVLPRKRRGGRRRR